MKRGVSVAEARQDVDRVAAQLSKEFPSPRETAFTTVSLDADNTKAVRGPARPGHGQRRPPARHLGRQRPRRARGAGGGPKAGDGGEGGPGRLALADPAPGSRRRLDARRPRRGRGRLAGPGRARPSPRPAAGSPAPPRRGGARRPRARLDVARSRSVGRALRPRPPPGIHAAPTWCPRSPRHAGRRRRLRPVFRSALVVAQVAMTLVLLVGAGLLTRTYAKIQRHRPRLPRRRGLDVPGSFGDAALFVARVAGRARPHAAGPPSVPSRR